MKDLNLSDADEHSDNLCENEKCQKEKSRVGSRVQNVCEDRK